jgi:hypothetical protein
MRRLLHAVDRLLQCARIVRHAIAMRGQANGEWIVGHGCVGRLRVATEDCEEEGK